MSNNPLFAPPLSGLYPTITFDSLAGYAGKDIGTILYDEMWETPDGGFEEISRVKDHVQTVDKVIEANRKKAILPAEAIIDRRYRLMMRTSAQKRAIAKRRKKCH